MSRKATMIGAAVLCALAGVKIVTNLSGPSASMAQAGGDVLWLTGVVRDFTPDHPDFDVSATGGHVVGNVALELDAGDNPVFTGDGFRVDRQWRDSFNRPIAPHRFNIWEVTGLCYLRPGIAVDGELILDNQAEVDSFDAELGRYGGSNVGANALIATNSTRPNMLQNVNSSEIMGIAMVGPGGDPARVYETQPTSVLTGHVDILTQPVPIFGAPVPAGIDDDVPRIEVNAGEVYRIDDDLRVGRFIVNAGGRVLIDDDVRLVVEQQFEIWDDASSEVYGGIELMGDARLDLFLLGDDSMIAGEINHNTGDPRRCTINVVGSNEIYLRRKRCHVVAYINAPDGHLRVGQGAALYGSFTGASAHVLNQGVVHVDASFMDDYIAPPDQEGDEGADSRGRISSLESFAEWFNDRLGANLSIAHTIRLRRTGPDGVYEYSTNRFLPIDDQLFGNDRGGHNYLFTYDIDATFLHESCAGQFIEFEGDGDAWIFIDGKLVMDLGGVIPRTEQFVEVDRLGLEPGRHYTLRFLHARRQFPQAGFSLRTNLPLVTRGAMPSAGFD